MQAQAAVQAWWDRKLLASTDPAARKLGEKIRQVRRPTPQWPNADALRVVEFEWHADVAVTAPGDGPGQLVSAEVAARWGSEDCVVDPCAGLDWLAWLFLRGLDGGLVSAALTGMEFAGMSEAGVAGEVWSELERRLAEGGVEMSGEDLALQLRLLGIDSSRRRRQLEACICLAEFTAEELHTQITLRLKGRGRRT
jgi:hypothetical protein